MRHELACAFLLPFVDAVKSSPTQRLKTAVYSLGFQELGDVLRMLRGSGFAVACDFYLNF